MRRNIQTTKNALKRVKTALCCAIEISLILYILQNEAFNFTGESINLLKLN